MFKVTRYTLQSLHHLIISSSHHLIIFSLLLFSFLPASSFAQKTTISGKIENICFAQVDLLLLYKDDGVSFGSAKINQDGTFKLNANIPQTDL